MPKQDREPPFYPMKLKGRTVIGTPAPNMKQLKELDPAKPIPIVTAPVYDWEDFVAWTCDELKK